MEMIRDVRATNAVEVDEILEQDPARAYALMDPPSRREYRERVTKWSDRVRLPVVKVASVVLELAANGAERYGALDRRAHVGYFLTDDGTVELAKSLKTRLTWWEDLRLRWKGSLVIPYCALIAALCIGFGAASVMFFDIRMALPGRIVLALAVAVFLSVTIQGLCNSLIARALDPRWMPRLDFRCGIPESAKTLVVIPCLLTSRDGIEQLARTLERIYLRNVRNGVGYAMLSDFVDAGVFNCDSDDILLAHARAQISLLNERHGGSFALLHRSRRWNKAEGCWMGWERKRGKLEELNAYLAGVSSPFHTMHGDLGVVKGARYVLTIDDDNGNLSPGAVASLAGAMAHPLHRPVLSEDCKRVTAGYTILMPLTYLRFRKDSGASRMEQLLRPKVDEMEDAGPCSSESIVDIDQGLFRENLYFGKGIYDAPLFHFLTHGLIAENTILNHDTIESGLVRAALVSDVLLDESFPPTFFAMSRRSHRWQRGDWQQIPWLFWNIRNAAGVRVKNTLSTFARWKIMQNIIRLLFPIAAILCFVLGWVAADKPGLWTLSFLAVVWTPALIRLLIAAWHGFRAGRFVSTVVGMSSELAMRFSGFVFGVHNAYIALDAILRASFRMSVSRSKLLEWTASIIDGNRCAPTLRQSVTHMWHSPAFAVIAVWFISQVNPPALPSALPLAGMWLAAPVLAWWWSQTPDLDRASALR
jgi:hypothetical protein